MALAEEQRGSTARQRSKQGAAASFRLSHVARSHGVELNTARPSDKEVCRTIGVTAVVSMTANRCRSLGPVTSRWPRNRRSMEQIWV